MRFTIARAAWLAGLLISAANAAPATDPAAASEWRLLGHNAEMQHYSSLAEVNAANVGHLGLAWYADMPTKDGLMGNALVADGVVYQSGTRSRIWANDVRTGKLLWEFDPKLHFDGTLNVGLGSQLSRGLALWDKYVYVGTADCRLVAVDRKTGVEAWESTACDNKDGHTISGAPRVGGGKVFIGNSNMDSSSGRGHVDAFDAATGKHLWRFYTVPGDPAKGFESKALEKAAKTWGKEWWKTIAGGSVWDAMTYDPKLNMLYFGTDSATPQNPLERGEGRGDELFTDAIVAVNADTGEYVWHYSTTPNDAWDYNATMHIMIAELPIGGKTRRVVMQAPKNGFFYVLDAHTGKLLSAQNIVPINWASHIDMKTGRPVELPDARYFDHPGEKVLVQPGGWGAHSWHAMSYSPKTGLVYIPASTLPMVVTLTNVSTAIGGHVHLDWLSPLREPEYQGKAGRLLAWDPVAQKARWSVTLPFPTNGGILSTGGNLVFEGTATGEFCAYQADSGKKLWSMQTGTSIQAAPTTVEIDGHQLILVPAGLGGGVAKMVPEFLGDKGSGPPRLLAFSLDGAAQLPPLAPEPRFAQPPRPRPASADLVQRGRALFENAGCDSCHGFETKRHVGLDSAPDLRRASAQTYDDFAAIVIGGARRDKGMPVFTGIVTAEGAQALQAYILSQAWDAYDKQQAAAPVH